MTRERITRIAVITAAMAIPAIALAAAAATPGEGGCMLSWCASFFACGG